jgi:hypothetical protein
MDIVYIVGHGSKWEDNELRYSIRSVVKNIEGYKNIIIVGHKPEWLTGVIHIPFKETGTANINIADKLVAACKSKAVSANFLYMQDDVFIVDKFHINDFKKRIFYKGTLDTTRTDYYGRLLNDSQKVLPENINYDNHEPIVINKTKLIAAYGKYKYRDYPEGLGTKSMYFQYIKAKGEFRKDNKIELVGFDWEANKRPIVSIGDVSIDTNFVTYMNKLYPEKSKYEKEVIDVVKPLYNIPKTNNTVKFKGSGKNKQIGTRTYEIGEQTAYLLEKKGFGKIVSK